MAEKNQKNKKSDAEKTDDISIQYVPSDIPTLYANNAQMIANNVDVSFILGESLGKNEENNTLQVIPHMKLTMSHQFLKQFARLINENLHLFENNSSDDKDANSDKDSAAVVR